MQEMSVKNSIRSFGDIKSNKISNISPTEASNISLQLTRIGKMLDESVLKFTKRYLIMQTELEEMKREFVGDVSLISEYLNLTKKEIRYDKIDNFGFGKYSNINNIPKIPNYEHRILTKGEKKLNKKSNNYNLNNINYYRKQNYNTQFVNINSNHKNNKSSNISNKISQEIKKDIFKEETLNRLNKNKINKNEINVNKEKKSLKNNEILKSLPDNKTKAIYILLNSEIVPYEEKLKLLTTKKIIYSQVTPNDIYNDTLLNIENKINLLKQNQIEEDELNIIQNLSSYPTKTAKTGLNFLNEEKENELMIDNELNQKLLEMICACLNENLIENKGENIKETYEQFFQKYNVNSIKDLFYEVIYKRIYNDLFIGKLSDKEIDEIINSISQNKILISDNLVSNNNNKVFSYVAFSLDEILEFLKGIKEVDDDLKEKIKNEMSIKSLFEEEDRIRNLIDN